MQVKICGISDAPGFDAAIMHGADWLGFVFFTASPRAVTAERAAELSLRHPGGAGRVGLFVRPSDSEIGRCLDRVRLDALQIYDSVERAQAIAASCGLPVWLACPVMSAADLPAAAPGIARLLIEGRAPASSGRPGGNGVALDWDMLRNWKVRLSWMLAGGLDAENVGEAIRRSGAEAVDVSSGVESRLGIKDPARIANFIASARGAARAGSAS